MQLSDLTSKTPEELNVMCAELLGWKCTGVNADNHSVWTKDNWTWVQANALPNYTGSWDAIMPEVRNLNRDKQHAMMRHLFELLDIVEEAEHGAVEITCACLLCDATEKQLTIALILTLTSQH